MRVPGTNTAWSQAFLHYNGRMNASSASEIATPGLIQRSAPVQEIFSSVQGEGVYVGKRQVFVRFAHCHLKCAYCDTPMQTSDGMAHLEAVPGSGELVKLENPMRPETLVDQIITLLRQTPHHSVSFTGGEPLLYHAFLKDVFPAIAPLSKTYLETSGTQPDFLAEILEDTDIIAMDIKLPSSTGEADQFDNHAAFYQLAKTRPETELFVKLVFNAEITDAEIRAVKTIVRDVSTPLILQPETSLKDRKVHLAPARILEVEAAFARHFEDVRVIPQTHKILDVL